MDIKSKLTSRKFWVAVAALAAGIVVLVRPGTDTTQITGLILTLGAVVAYIAGEGFVDAAAAGSVAVIPAETTAANPEQESTATPDASAATIK